MPAETTSNTRGRLNAEMLETKWQTEFNYSPLDCIFMLDSSTFLAGLRGSQVEVRSSTVVSSLYLNKFFPVRLFFAVMLRGFMTERQQKVWIEVDQKHPNIHSWPSVSALYCCTVTKSVQDFANNLNETTSFSNTSVSSQQMYLWRVAPAVCFAIVPQHLNDPHQSSLQHAASL